MDVFYIHRPPLRCSLAAGARVIDLAHPHLILNPLLYTAFYNGLVESLAIIVFLGMINRFDRHTLLAGAPLIPSFLH